MDASTLTQANPRDPHHARAAGAEHTPVHRSTVVGVGWRVVAAAGPAVHQ
jgi:hypothetical protein